MRAMPATPFTVIGGFLGAGKTTVLNRILSNAPVSARAPRYAVLVNDFGAINIDKRLIQSEQGEVLSLANGCICCSLTAGFVTTMVALMQRRSQFDHIIVEASGVSNPDRIMDFARIDPDLAQDAIIILVDAANFTQQYADPLLSDTLKPQVAAANLIIINKIDRVAEAQLVLLHSVVAELNPSAAVLYASYAALPMEALLGRGGDHSGSGAGATNSARAASVQPLHQHGFYTCAVERDHVIDAAAFRALARALPGSILRAKGILRFASGWHQWHRAGNHNQISKMLGNRDTSAGSSELVFIGTVKQDIEGIKTRFLAL